MIYYSPAKMIGRSRIIAAGVMFFLVVLAGLTDVYGADSPGLKGLSRGIAAERWPEAESVFHSDPRWLGGDGASSMDLGDGRVLWLFGDSFVDVSGTGSRHTATLVRNTIAVQTGYNPCLASMDFAWKMKADRPVAFFAKSGDPDTWYWPASGILMGKKLLIFLMTVRAADNALGFETCGWKAAWIDNPQEPPDAWNPVWLISPQCRNLVVGVGNPVLENGFLHVFAADGRDLSIYLARWPAAAAFSGTLTAPQWWTGETGAQSGWEAMTGANDGLRPVMKGGQMEFSVTRRSESGRYRRVQTKSFLDPCLAVSTASALTGPWTDAGCFFTPPEQGDPELLIYAGKSHPALTGVDLVFSYVVNTTAPERLLTDMSLYFPIMLKGKMLPE